MISFAELCFVFGANDVILVLPLCTSMSKGSSDVTPASSCLVAEYMCI